MRLATARISAAAATLALAAPGVALAAGPGNTGAPGQTGVHPTQGHGKPYKTMPPTTGAPTHAYGKYCQNESKKHIKGQKGTPFSQCVTALAHLGNGTASTPTAACKTLSKKHVKGTQGTPFSQCVKATAQLPKTSS